MSKQKYNNAKVKKYGIKIEKVEQISNIWAESFKPILQNVSLMSKALESVRVPKEQIEAIDEMSKKFEILGQQLNQLHQGFIELIQPMIDVISKIEFPKINIDFSEYKIYFYRTAFEEKEAIVNSLYSNTIFPPILYIIKSGIKESNFENWEEWVLNDRELKLFYIDSINKWKDKYSDDNIMRMIDEIKFNFEYGNSYSVYMLVAVLIEYMLGQNYSDKITSKYRYNSIKNVLNEKVFEPININELYIRFIEENLYANTNKAKEFSRHIAHGDKIEFGNMKSAMNMIFIYDFLQDVMVITE